jgi:hypothetical protein
LRKAIVQWSAMEIPAPTRSLAARSPAITAINVEAWPVLKH